VRRLPPVTALAAGLTDRIAKPPRRNTVDKIPATVHALRTIPLSSHQVRHRELRHLPGPRDTLPPRPIVGTFVSIVRDWRRRAGSSSSSPSMVSSTVSDGKESVPVRAGCYCQRRIRASVTTRVAVSRHLRRRPRARARSPDVLDDVVDGCRLGVRITGSSRLWNPLSNWGMPGRRNTSYRVRR